MTLSPSISRLIRENKIWEIPQYIEEGDVYGMVSFEQVLFSLVKEDIIEMDVAISFSDKPEELRLRLRHGLSE
jgi:Tfp pilus assembly pilus retraction ATPase PilT